MRKTRFFTFKMAKWFNYLLLSEGDTVYEVTPMDLWSSTHN